MADEEWEKSFLYNSSAHTKFMVKEFVEKAVVEGKIPVFAPISCRAKWLDQNDATGARVPATRPILLYPCFCWCCSALLSLLCPACCCAQPSDLSLLASGDALSGDDQTSSGRLGSSLAIGSLRFRSVQQSLLPSERALLANGDGRSNLFFFPPPTLFLTPSPPSLPTEQRAGRWTRAWWRLRTVRYSCTVR